MEIELNVLEQTNILHIKSAFTKEQCKEITKEILVYKSTNNPNDYEFSKDANEGCWMGRPHFNNGFSKSVEILLVDTFKNACSEYYKSMPKPLNITKNNLVITPDQWELDAWANVNEPGSINREHTHTGAFVSAVVYFQAEGTGSLQFMPYNFTYKMTLPQWPYFGTSYYDPVDGNIILFPSYLLHKVERNLSNTQRINISFNAFPPVIGDPYARY